MGTLFPDLKLTDVIIFEMWIDSPQRPRNFPKHPDRVYKDEWKGWAHFFGIRVMSFEELKQYVQNRGIKTANDYENLRNPMPRPVNEDGSIERHSFRGMKRDKYKEFIKHLGDYNDVLITAMEKESLQRPKKNPDTTTAQIYILPGE